MRPRQPAVLYGTFLATAWLALLAGVASWRGDAKASEPAASELPKPNLTETLIATSSARQPLNLLLTQSELLAVVRDYEVKTGEVHTTPIDDEEVLVTAPGYLAPMRDATQDVGPGIFAPFWAIMNPKDAWRIFVPIPPKGGSQESERPAPDPR